MVNSNARPTLVTLPAQAPAAAAVALAAVQRRQRAYLAPCLGQPAAAVAREREGQRRAIRSARRLPRVLALPAYRALPR